MKRGSNRKLLIIIVSILILNLAREGSCSSSFNGVPYTSPTEYPWVSSPFERVENRIEEDEEEEEQEVASLDGQDLQFHWDEADYDDVEDGNNGLEEAVWENDEEEADYDDANENETVENAGSDLENDNVEEEGTDDDDDDLENSVNEPEESIVIDVPKPAVRLPNDISVINPLLLVVKPQIPISPIIVSPKSTVSSPTSPSPSQPPDSLSPPIIIDDSGILQNDVLARVLSNPISLAGVAFASFMGTLCLSFGVYSMYFVHVF